jgi:hypothetical protein
MEGTNYARTGKLQRKCRAGVFIHNTTMKQRIAAGILTVALGFVAVAGIPENPSEVIVARNIFGLRPMPVVQPPPPEEPPAPPLPEIKVTGITTLLGKPIATLQYEDKEAKKIEFPPLLAEGEKYKDLIVERIDVEAQTVAIVIGDTRTTLDFVRNGVKPTASKTVAQAVTPAATPAISFPNFPGRPNGSNGVFVAGGGVVTPQTRTQMTPEQARAYLEDWRQKQAAQQGAILPPGARPGVGAIQ